MSEPNREPNEQPAEPSDEAIHIDAQDARGAEIILRKRRNRLIFIAGLVGFAVLAVVANLFV